MARPAAGFDGEEARKRINALRVSWRAVRWLMPFYLSMLAKGKGCTHQEEPTQRGADENADAMAPLSSHMNILMVTLARGGSKSVHKKNIIPLLGVPLIAYTVVEARRSSFEADYVVSTDDEEIAECARRYGAEVPFVRPPEISDDQASSASGLIHALRWMEANRGKIYDIVVELMCTNPMKTSHDIDAVIRKMLETGADSVIGVIRLFDHHPIRVKKIEDDRLVDFCLYEKPENRRQDLQPPAYLRNGAIYAVRRRVLMETGARYGTVDSRPYVMEAESSVNIDGPLDVLLAEALLRRRPREYIASGE